MLVWLNAVRALRAWKQTVAILVAPPVVTIILVLLQLLANVVVDKEGEAPRGSGCGSCAENGLPAAPLFALGSALPRCGAAVPTPCAPLPPGPLLREQWRWALLPLLARCFRRPTLLRCREPRGAGDCVTL